MARAARVTPLTVSVNRPFTLFTSRSLSTQAGCFASNMLSRANFSLCCYNVCVCYTNPLGLPQDFLSEGFRWYRTEWSLLQFVWRVFAVVCFPHMIRSTRRIVEDDLRRSR